MAFRSCSRLFRAVPRVPIARGGQRSFSSAAGAKSSRSAARVMMGLAGVSTIAYGVHKYLKSDRPGFLSVAHAVGPTQQEAQNSVFSQTKKHAVYIWIHLKSHADVKACGKVAANLQQYVDFVIPPKEADEEEEIWAGVGFGPNFYHRAFGHRAPESYSYPHRKGGLGDLPSTGGDIFIHAKSDSVSNLFDLTKQVIGAFPARSIDKFEDVYSFVYENGRDLSGFIDGTENPADEDDRKAVAVDKQGGSYVITQRWIHNLDVIKTTQVKMQEAWFGRTKPDSMELKNKPKSSHVARIVGGPEFSRPKPFQIVRQSMPYGNLSGEAGLFFIGYAGSPANFEFMLNRMVGADPDGLSDDIMRFTKCVSGNYWYFPSKQELKKLA